MDRAPPWLGALRDERLPAVVVDLDAFDRNVRAVAEAVRAAGPLPVRVATKSVRVPELLRRIAAADPVYRGWMTYSAHETRALWEDGFDDFLQNAKPIFYTATVLIRSMIGFRLQEFIDQVTIRSVNFDTVESRFVGKFGGMLIIPDDTRNLFRLERPRDFVGLLPLRSMNVVASELDRRGRDRQLAVMETAVRGTTTMPELKEDHAAFFVNGIDDRLPGFNHLVLVDSRGTDPADGFFRNRRTFQDHQSGGTSLNVICGCGGIRRAFRPCSPPRHGGENDSITQNEITQCEWLEQRLIRHLCFLDENELAIERERLRIGRGLGLFTRFGFR